MKLLRIATVCLIALGCWSAASAQVKLDANAQYRTVADVLVLIDQIKPDPERVKAYRAKLSKPLPPADAYWFTKRDALVERMDAAESLGDLKTRLESADAIMAIFRERKDRIREMEFAFSYAGMLRDAGKTAQAIALEEEMVRDPQSYAHWVLSYHNRRASTLSAQGNLAAAQPHLDAANTEFKRHYHYTAAPNTAASNAWVNATFKRAQGKYVEAEALYQQANKEAQRWVNNVGSISSAASHALPSNRSYSAYLGYRLTYVEMLLDLGRTQDAERLAREPLLWALERMGKYSPHSARAASAYADVLGGQGRHIEAEKLARVSLEIAQGIGAEPDSTYTRSAERSLARALLGQGRVREADETFQLRTYSAESSLDSARAVAAILNGRASVFVSALALHAERVASNVGEKNPLAGEARGLYAMALAATAQDATTREQAAVQFRLALPALLASRQQSSAGTDAVRSQISEYILQSYLALLSQSAATDPRALTDSFVVADWLRGSSTQNAVAASAARAAVSDPALAAAVRREQDLRTERIALHRALQRLSTLSPEQLKESGEDPSALRSRIETLTREHEGLFADIAKRFPKYANLIDPQPPTVDDLRKALRAGEVVVSILTTPERSFVWAVPQSGAVLFHSSALGETAIAPIVKGLRSALDVGKKEASQWAAIDVVGSHQIYRELLQPVQAAFNGAHTMIVAANNSLASLPPALLVTAPTTLGKDAALPFDRYMAVPWLDKQYATAQVPSVNALVSLRALAVNTAQRKPFMGFGDPVFSAAALPSSAATRSAGVAVRNAPTERISAQTMREGNAVAWTPYSKLAPLPDTREEVIAMAKALGADPVKDVVLGAQVTKQRVKQTDLSATRIVAFATHGLIAGDFPGLSQPALALSAPAGKDADKEPLEALFTLEDVLQLKMDADWVVLSACNTAAADGQGSEAVSGLGRGFFYAGSRALLVTHWSVDSESAKDLVSHTFASYAKDPQITRANALQAAMQHIRSSAGKDEGGTSYSLAHPLFWAPYALVGEPGR
jgi:CHAT domain-containing protein